VVFGRRIALLLFCFERWFGGLKQLASLGFYSQGSIFKAQAYLTN
jgi:hypothetical protein